MERYDISFSEFISDRIYNSDNQRDAEFLLKTKQDVLDGKPYPSRQELHDKRFTEADLAKLVFIKAIPGGAGSVLTTEIMEGEYQQIPINQPENRRIRSILGMHGSDVPAGNAGVELELAEDERMRSERIARGEHVDPRASIVQPSARMHWAKLQGETSCGLSDGDTSKLERIFDQRTAEIEELSRRFGNNIDVVSIGAYVGARNPDYPVYSNAAFNVHDINSDIRFRYRNSGEVIDNPVMDSMEYNNALRRCFEEGTLVNGLNCFDRRSWPAGLNYPTHEELLDVALQVRSTTPAWRKIMTGGIFTPMTGFQAEGHSEIPFLVVSDGTDKNILALAAGMMREKAVLLNNHYAVKPSAIGFASIPEDMSDEGRSLLGEQMFRLLANLNREAFGQAGFQLSKTQHFVEEGGKYRRVETPVGVRIICSEKVKDRYFKGFSLPKWSMPNPEASSGHPNPPIWLKAGHYNPIITV